MEYTSKYPLGARVEVNGMPGVVVGIKFIPRKVLHDVDLDIGGHTLCNIDSTFVEPAPVALAA